MIKQFPKFVRAIRKEHVEVEKLVRRYNIDLVISDNRYGCWSEKVTSVFMTHQLNILVPGFVKWMRPIVRLVSDRLIRKFSVCWIPDSPDIDSSLAGDLIGDRKNLPVSVRYVGPLSRFKREETNEIKYDAVCILSGPEPQRSMLEEAITSQLKNLPLRSFLVRGIPTESSSSKYHADFLNSKALQTVISQSSVVIARSGYSTILDLAALGKKAIFIPTPGQTEQEYLADRLEKKRVACKIRQNNMNIEEALHQSNKYNGFAMTSNDTHSLLTKALNDIL
jgi:UDP-N-acetylglucosamine transferase subunit ALG13